MERIDFSTAFRQPKSEANLLSSLDISYEKHEIGLQLICKAEDVNCSADALSLLIDVCDGDLRKAITNLQSAARYFEQETIGVEDVGEIAGIIPNECIEEMLETAETRSFDNMEKFIQKLEMQGYPGYQLLLQMHDALVAHPLLSDRSKAVLCEKIAVCDQRLQDGGCEYLQLMDLGCALISQFEKM